MAYDDEEIKRHLKEQRSRGKKPPIPEEVIRRHLIRMRIVGNLLAEPNFSRFCTRLNETGLVTGSKEYEIAVDAWLDHWRDQR